MFIEHYRMAENLFESISLAVLNIIDLKLDFLNKLTMGFQKLEEA